MLTDASIRTLVEAELRRPQFAMTEQLLGVHEPLRDAGRVQIARIDRETRPGFAIVYFPVVGEPFHFVVVVNLADESTSGLYTEQWNRVYLRASSTTDTYEQMCSHTKIKPTSGWGKGDVRPGVKRGLRYEFSALTIECEKIPDTFENVITRLLDRLEEDSAGICTLVDLYEAHLQAAIYFHNGNTMLGGMWLSAEVVERMSRLRLSIDFDLYADGELWEG